MKISQTNKILSLLYILQNKECDFIELIEIFKRKNIEISKATLKKYFNLLKQNGIPLKISKNKNKNLYCLELKKDSFQLDDKDVKLLCDLKKIVINDYNYKEIRQIMEFYLLLKDFVLKEDLKYSLIDFGYYSTINWYILEELEKHCQNNSVVEIEYVLPKGEIQNYIFHLDKIKVNDENGRIYIYGINENYKRFSQLPIERIFSIKKVLRKNKQFNVICELLNAKIKKENFDISKFNPFYFKNTDKDYYVFEYPLIDDFDTIQILLQLCPNIYDISNENIKEKLFNKLKAMETLYL